MSTRWGEMISLFDDPLARIVDAENEVVSFEETVDELLDRASAHPLDSDRAGLLVDTIGYLTILEIGITKFNDPVYAMARKIVFDF